MFAVTVAAHGVVLNKIIEVPWLVGTSDDPVELLPPHVLSRRAEGVRVDVQAT